MQPLLASFISVGNPTGAEPVPNSALMNDTQNVTIPLEKGKTYMVRMVRAINITRAIILNSLLTL